MKKALVLNNISKGFSVGPRSLPVLKDIDLEIDEGEFFVLVGPSGSGKSTLLRIMSGLENSFTGTRTYGATYTHDTMSFVFQQFALLPWLTVYQNIELGLLSRYSDKEARKEIVMRELKQFGLEKFRASHPRELSGGMRQRVGLARAMAIEPKIIFMDEPFSELDSFTAEELRKDLLSIWEQRKQTIIMVTHIVEEAVELADRIGVLTPRPARIEKIICNTLRRPRKMRSTEFYRLEDAVKDTIRP